MTEWSKMRHGVGYPREQMRDLQQLPNNSASFIAAFGCSDKSFCFIFLPISIRVEAWKLIFQFLFITWPNSSPFPFGHKQRRVSHMLRAQSILIGWPPKFKPHNGFSWYFLRNGVGHLLTRGEDGWMLPVSPERFLDLKSNFSYWLLDFESDLVTLLITRFEK